MRFTIDDLRIASLLVDGGKVYDVERLRGVVTLSSRSKPELSIFGTDAGVIGFKADLESAPYLIGFFSGIFDDLPPGADGDEESSEFCWLSVREGNPILLPRLVRTELSLTGKSVIDLGQRPIPRRPGFIAHLSTGRRASGG